MYFLESGNYFIITNQTKDKKSRENWKTIVTLNKLFIIILKNNHMSSYQGDTYHQCYI